MRLMLQICFGKAMAVYDEMIDGVPKRICSNYLKNARLNGGLA